MEMKTLTLEVPKEITEVGECVKEILEKTAEALKDGWQPGQDVPVVLASAFSGLMKAIEGCQNIPEEAIAMPMKSGLGVAVPVALGIDVMLTTLKKTPQAPQA